jgi:hypothetical protein
MASAEQAAEWLQAIGRPAHFQRPATTTERASPAIALSDQVLGRDWVNVEGFVVLEQIEDVQRDVLEPRERHPAAERRSYASSYS